MTFDSCGVILGDVGFLVLVFSSGGLVVWVVILPSGLLRFACCQVRPSAERYCARAIVFYSLYSIDCISRKWIS